MVLIYLLECQIWIAVKIFIYASSPTCSATVFVYGISRPLVEFFVQGFVFIQRGPANIHKLNLAGIIVEFIEINMMSDSADAFRILAQS